MSSKRNRFERTVSFAGDQLSFVVVYCTLPTSVDHFGTRLSLLTPMALSPFWKTVF